MSLQWADLVNDFSKTLQDQTFVNQIYTNQVHIEMQWFPEVYKSVKTKILVLIHLQWTVFPDLPTIFCSFVWWP